MKTVAVNGSLNATSAADQALPYETSPHRPAAGRETFLGIERAISHLFVSLEGYPVPLLAVELESTSVPRVESSGSPEKLPEPNGAE